MPSKSWVQALRNHVAVVVGLVACALLFCLLPAVRERLTGTPLNASLRAYAQGNWSSTVASADQQLAQTPDEPTALRLKARALAQLGRDRESRSIYHMLGSAFLECEDLLLIGKGLVNDGHLAMGSVLVEAASKLDSRHPGISAALAETHRKLKADPKAAEQADRLSAVPDAKAATEAVLAFSAILTQTPLGAGSESIPERALRSPRSVFLTLDSPAAVRKYIARMLLEEGRTAEAKALLEKIVAREADLEANWLLSRVYLVEGSIEKASEFVEKSGTFENDHPIAPEPGCYAGAKSCAECHGTIFHAQQNSNHAATITWGDGLKLLKIPGEPVKDSEEPDVIHRWVRTDEGIVASADVGRNHYQGIVDYVLGSGHHGLSMLAKEKGGGHRSLRLSYYPPGDSWSMTGGFNPHPTDPHVFLGESLSEESVRKCLNCHSTRFISENDRKSPEANDKGIGCERCHGPGDNHLRSIASGFPQLAIARPKLATPTQRMALCAQCHLANGGIPPSDPKFIRFQSTTFAYSKCYTQSGGRLDCIACHDPHRNAETSEDYYQSRCLSCHAANPSAKPQNATFRFEAIKATACPVNPTRDCLSCHMPKFDNVMPFSKFTDHHIRVRRQESQTSAPASSD